MCIREIWMNGDPDDNVCHVSLWDACHVFLRGRGPYKADSLFLLEGSIPGMIIRELLISRFLLD